MDIRLTFLLLFLPTIFGCGDHVSSPNEDSPARIVEMADTQRHHVLLRTRNASYSVFPDTDDPEKLKDPTFLDAMHAETANGSSFAVRGDGLVLTNAHVIEGTNYCTGQRLSVRPGAPPPSMEDMQREDSRENEASMREGGKKPTHCLLVAQDFSRVFRAKLIKIDQKHDVAVLCIQGANREIPHLAVEGPAKIREGIEVLTVGSPLGNTNMMTHGYVSNLDFKEQNKETGMRGERKVQFSAPILPGNSGGPLVSVASGNVIGQVVAIIAARGVPTQMSYANPVEDLLAAMRGVPPCEKQQ